MLEITYSNLSNYNRRLDLSQIRVGTLPTNVIKTIKPMHNENRRWQVINGKKYFGNYVEEEWYELLDDIRINGLKHPITIFVEQDGKIVLAEGNHRLQALKQLNIEEEKVEIRYFGNSQAIQNFFDKYTKNI